MRPSAADSRRRVCRIAAAQSLAHRVCTCHAAALAHANLRAQHHEDNQTAPTSVRTSRRLSRQQSAVAPTAVACSCVRRFPCLARRMCQRPPLTPACLGAMPFAHCQCEIRGTFTCATKLHAPRVLLQIDSLTDCQAASIRPSAHRPQPGGTKRFVTCRRRKQTLLPANPDVVLPRRDIRHIESLSLAKSKSSR